MSEPTTRSVPHERDVLISGASVAGPVLAWWLHRHGFRPTVVERTPLHRAGTGGHAVDLFEPAVEVLDRMGLLSQVEAARTHTERITLERPGRRPVDVDFGAVTSVVSDARHVEIMRGELAGILHEATRSVVDYRFGDSVRSIVDGPDGVDVEFEHGPGRRFSLVVGADGLHSGVRALTFGAEARFAHHLGGYLAAFTVPNYRGLSERIVVHPDVDRLVGMYPVWQTGQARAVFLFRRAEPLPYDHRDVDAQRALLRAEFADAGWEAPRLLVEADRAEDFYLDAISQIRMGTWSRGRVTLVGDSGYSPGPAVGGGPPSPSSVPSYWPVLSPGRRVAPRTPSPPTSASSARTSSRVGRSVRRSCDRWSRVRGPPSGRSPGSPASFPCSRTG